MKHLQKLYHGTIKNARDEYVLNKDKVSKVPFTQITKQLPLVLYEHALIFLSESERKKCCE